MQKTTFLLIFMSAYSIQVNSMQPNDNILAKPSLSALLHRKRIDLSCISNFKEFATTVRALAVTSKSLNLFINDSSRTLEWIKHYSNRDEEPHITIAEQLGTYEANRRYVIQKTQLSNINLNKLIAAGYDCNFTNINEETALMNFATAYGAWSSDAVAQLLIKHSDINQQDPRGKTAFMVALENYQPAQKNRSKVISMLLDCDQLDLDCQDCYGNTLLHCCIESLLSWQFFERTKSGDISRHTFIYEVIEKLLKRGANPAIKNDHDQIPLEFALNPHIWNSNMLHQRRDSIYKFVPVKIEYEPILELLRKATPSLYK